VIAGEEVLALITARGGSKRIPRKNVRVLGTKPLIAWTIEAALNAPLVDRVVLSTDDAEIAGVARERGCDVPFVRPAEFAGDHSSSTEVALHALEALEHAYRWLVLLQPTSPFRTAEDIDACIRACADGGADSAISLCPTERSPVVMFTIGEKSTIVPVVESDIDLQVARSQDLPPAYEINGAIYVVRTRHLIETGAFFDASTIAYVMPRARSVNIDTEMDFAWAELLLGRASPDG